MLADILRSLSSSNGVASFSQLAAAAGVAVSQLEPALNQLERMGYVRREAVAGGCPGSCNPAGVNHCAGCACSPAAGVWTWILTERGRAAVAAAPQP